MKFTPGPIGADFSGSIGSTTASRNRFGPYLRTKAIPINPNTVRQQTIRALFATMVNVWTNTLTQLERDNWDLWAANTTILGKDGSPINITGQNAYVRYNVIRRQIGGIRVDTAPLAFNNGNPVTDFIAIDGLESGELQIDLPGTNMNNSVIVSGGASDDADIAIYLGGPINFSRTFFKGPYQLADTLELLDAATNSSWATVLTAMTQAIDVADLQFRSVRFRVVYDDGRLSEKFEALAQVTQASV